MIFLQPLFFRFFCRLLFLFVCVVFVVLIFAMWRDEVVFDLMCKYWF